MKANFKVIGLTRLGIKPEYTAPEADALVTLQSELFKKRISVALLVTYERLAMNFRVT